MTATARAARTALSRAFARTAIAPEVGSARGVATVAAGGGARSGVMTMEGSSGGQPWVAVGGGWKQQWGGSQQQQRQRRLGAARGFAADATPGSSDDKPPAANKAEKDPDDDRVVDMDREDFPNASPRVRRLADDICQLTLLEVHDMTEILKKRLNINAPVMFVGGNQAQAMMAGGAPAAMGAGGGAPAAAAAEQTEFTVKLESYDSAQKIKVIKEVRAITELGLKEAKDLVEGAPAVLKKGLKKEDAEAIKEKITKVGGVVVLE